MAYIRKLVLCAGILSFTGCAYFSPIAVSTTHLDPEHEIALGIVQGKAVNSYFLGAAGGDEEGMKVAVENAKLKVADADNLVNVYVDRRVTYYPCTILPLYTRVETIVTGTAVRYKDRSMNKIPDHTPQPAQPTPSKSQPAVDGAL